MKELTLLLLFCLHFLCLKAQYKKTDYGLSGGILITSKGSGINLSLIHGGEKWWAAYLFDVNRYRTNTDELPVLLRPSMIPLKPIKKLDKDDFVNYSHGISANHHFIFGLRKMVSKKSWLGIGTGFSIIHSRRAKKVHMYHSGGSGSIWTGDLFTSLAIGSLFSSSDNLQLEFENKLKVGVPLVLRLQTFNHKAKEIYVQLGGVVAVHRLSSLQFSFGKYLRMNTSSYGKIEPEQTPNKGL